VCLFWVVTPKYSAFYFPWYSTSTFWFSECLHILASGTSYDNCMKFLCLAYFVAKKEKKKIYMSLYMLVYSVFILQNCLYAYACITVVAIILQLFQVMCRCCLLCYNVLMFLMI